MRNTSHVVCGAIPHHMLKRVAAHATGNASEDARATLEHMQELESGRVATSLLESAAAPPFRAAHPRKNRCVYDARHQFVLPGQLAMNEHEPHSTDVEVAEAYDGSGATWDFFSRVFDRDSVDDKGLRLVSTVHYGTSFENAFWNGRQMIYGHADGRIFIRFTASIDVIAHELTHGVTQYAAALGYSGETGALNEHLSDACGIMVKQYMLGHSARKSGWLIGEEILGPDVAGRAIRSMDLPGSAYDDPVLGRDPQPSHMRDYVDTIEDHGGVHINSGILNQAFYIAAIEIGGYTWEVLGRIWYAALTDRLKPDADFADFARATVDIAGELYGNGGRVQRILRAAWSDVGLSVPLFGCVEKHTTTRRTRRRAVRPRSRKGEWKS
jgi:Zn-dependent metalloprotease